jgi:hypothetical protein
MFCLVRRDLRQEKAVASADRDADLDAAVRRNFRELSLELGRGFHPSALAGEEVYSVAHLERRPLVADQSADQERDVQADSVAKVEGHRDSVRRGEVRQSEVHLADEVVRQAVALAEELRVQPSRERLAVLVQQVSVLERRGERPPAQELLPKAEPQDLPPVVLEAELPARRSAGQQAVARLAPPQQAPEWQALVRAPQEQAQQEPPVSAQPPLAAEAQPVQPPELQALAR